MGWAETAREKRRAPIGEYRPERYTVVVYDTFEQYKLRMAALTIRNGMSVPEFFLYCAEYVLDHHRKLKDLRRIFRKGAREVCIAAAEPVGSEFMEPKSEEQRRRREALDRFCEWAAPELFPPKTVEWP